MRLCPICDAEYPNDHLACPSDGAKLLANKDWDPGTVIRGKYRIVAPIGRGGMGTVYKAEHIAFQEIRALKVMATYLASDQQFVRRFRQEAQVARRLRHPNIVHVDDLDQADDGSLFIVMDYIEGISLSKLMRDTGGPLPVDRTLGIIRGVAEALAASHEQGVIHRDIKPDNILLTQDAEGKDVPKVLDFGIVAMKESSATLSIGLLLTPPYAPPEQWRGMKSSELDGRADLYALGVTWYEMLTGHLPFQAQNTEAWMRAHLDEVPPPPTKWHSPLETYPELNAVVLKLLAKDREQRTRDAKELLQQINELKTVISGRDVRVHREKTLIEIPNNRKRSQKRERTVIEDLPRQRTLIEQVPQPLEAQQVGGAGPAANANVEVAVRKPSPLREIIIGISITAVLIAIIVALAVFFTSPQSALKGHPQNISSLAFSPSGNILATGGGVDSVLWNVTTHRELLSYPQDNVHSVAFSPDGRMLASAGDKSVELWDTTTGKQIQSFSGHTDRILSVAISPNGAMMASGSADKSVKLWNLTTGHELQTFPSPDTVSFVAFSPDGRFLAYLASGSVFFRDLSTGHTPSMLVRLPLFFLASKGLNSYIDSISFSPDSKLLAGASRERLVLTAGAVSHPEVTLWNVESGNRVLTLSGHKGSIRSIAFSPDGKLLASGSSDQTVKLWSVETGKEVQTFTGHEATVTSVAFSPNGKLLASASDNQIVRFWDIE